MSEIKDYGPAFPGSYKGQQGEIRWSEGMTKREWFAGMALQGLIVKLDFKTNLDTYAEDAYKFADSMIRAGKGE